MTRRSPFAGMSSLSALVVELALIAPVDAAHGDAIWLVEVGHGLVVLALPVLDDQAVIGVERVDGQADTSAVCAGVTEEPVEAVLSLTLLAE